MTIYYFCLLIFLLLSHDLIYFSSFTGMNSSNLLCFRAVSVSPYTSWLSKISDTDILLAAHGNSGVVTVDMGGSVRLWETGLESIQRSLLEWRNMIGQDDGRPVQVKYCATFAELFEVSVSTYKILFFLF